MFSILDESASLEQSNSKVWAENILMADEWSIFYLSRVNGVFHFQTLYMLLGQIPGVQ